MTSSSSLAPSTSEPFAAFLEQVVSRVVYRWRLYAAYALYLGVAFFLTSWLYGLWPPLGWGNMFLAGVGVFLWHGALRLFGERFPNLSPFTTQGDTPGTCEESFELQRAKAFLPGFWAGWMVSSGLAQSVEHVPFSGPSYTGVRETPRGIVIDIRAGSERWNTVDRIGEALSRLASGIDIAQLQFVKVDQLSCQLLVPLRDPFAGLPTLDGPPRVFPASLGVPIGVDDEGNPVVLSPKNVPGLLATGIPGSGKTVLVRVLLAAWLLGGARVRIADFKGAGDFNAFTGRCEVIQDDIPATVAMLREAEAEMRGRLSAMSDTGAGSNWWTIPLGEREPFTVIAIDEVQDLLETVGVDWPCPR